jgi:putative transposase
VLTGVSIVVQVITDLIGWVALAFRSRRSLQSEVLFLRRQLALYVERGVKPRRIDVATRVSLACCRSYSSGARRWLWCGRKP